MDMNSQTRSRDRVSLWIVLTAGLLLLGFAAVSHATDYASATRRTDRFSEAPGLTSLAVENVSGDIQVTAGAAFSATAEVSVRADSPGLAKKYLDETRIELRHDGGGAYSLITEEPGVRVSHRNGRRWDVQVNRSGSRYRIESRYTITVAPNTSLDVHTVNGHVAVNGVTAAVDASSVNGRVKIAGTRHDVHARSVNGSIETAAADLPRGARVDAETVNGNIELQLPARAAFELHGHTMNGDIVSSFPLPPREAPAEAEHTKAERDRMRAERERIRHELRMKEREHGDEDPEIDVDLSGLREDLEELSRELSGLGPEIAAEISQSLNHSYEGKVAGGGAEIRCSTLNGRIAVLAEGTTSGQAKSLLPRRRSSHGSWSVSEPSMPMPVVAPMPPHAPMAPHAPRAPRPPEREEGSIVRGDIDGDFSTTLPFGDVQVGKVAGSVKIVTYGGEIRVAEAGKGADVSTSGGDIQIDGVRGDLRAITHGGEVRVGSVSGNAKLETMGGDVELGSCGGSVTAKTGGGDLRLHRVRGSVQASSGGGGISCEIVGRENAEGVSLSSGGGDVTLVLPANYKGTVDVQVNGVDEESDAIFSEFPEITVSRRSSSSRQTATGALNGGGPRIGIRISSGTVHLKKGPPA